MTRKLTQKSQSKIILKIEILCLFNYFSHLTQYIHSVKILYTWYILIILGNGNGLRGFTRKIFSFDKIDLKRYKQTGFLETRM